MPIEIASSSPSSRRTIIARFAHGHARATTSRYRPASTGHGEDPSDVIRSIRATGLRSKSSRVDRVDGVADMPGNLRVRVRPVQAQLSSSSSSSECLCFPLESLSVLLVFGVRVFVGVLEVVRLV